MFLRMHRHVLYGCVLVCVMLAARIAFTNQFTYLFLVWNLFLAWIPLAVAIVSKKLALTSWKLIVATFIWLVFFPNAPYLITDLYHLSHFKKIPAWYDALMLFTAAYCGVVTGFISLQIMEEHWKQTWQVKYVSKRSDKSKFRLRLFLLAMLFTATGFGLYLGRVLRYNSWDVLTDTNTLAFDILDRIANPLSHVSTWGFSFIYAAVLFFFYSSSSWSNDNSTEH
ncbi:DUF1361 domain-containing protein [soil metagenome]